MKRIRVQLRAELLLLARNGEQLLLTLVIPVLLLAFFGSVDILPSGDMESIQFLVPGILAIAIMSTSMVSLGIATGFERSYLVLKRLGATPLTRNELVIAKILSVFVVQIIQAAILLPLGFVLGWDPGGSQWPLAVLVVLAGTSAFAGIGLFLAGQLRAEINLAAQNGLYLLLVLLGGMMIPRTSLPDFIGTTARALPSTALADLLRTTLNGDGGALLAPFAILLAWGFVAPAIAARRFRWS
jgi:ABC-2 type transport system permease protein